MQLNLSPELAQFIDDQVAAGVYLTPNEVIGDAIRLLRHHEQERSALVAELRRRVDIGIAQLDRGESIPADEVFRKLREKTSGN
jgi:antitoxin ParD1/3/4